jgi:hypothetical protein
MIEQKENPHSQVLSSKNQEVSPAVIPAPPSE